MPKARGSRFRDGLRLVWVAFVGKLQKYGYLWCGVTALKELDFLK